MPFKKGQSGNPAGRPQGAIGEKAELWNQLGEFIVTTGAQRAMEALMEMENEEFLKNYMTMLEYFKPKQARNVHASDSNSPVIVQIHGNI